MRGIVSFVFLAGKIQIVIIGLGRAEGGQFTYYSFVKNTLHYFGKKSIFRSARASIFLNSAYNQKKNFKLKTFIIIRKSEKKMPELGQ